MNSGSDATLPRGPPYDSSQSVKHSFLSKMTVLGQHMLNLASSSTT